MHKQPPAAGFGTFWIRNLCLWWFIYYIIYTVELPIFSKTGCMPVYAHATQTLQFCTKQVDHSQGFMVPEMSQAYLIDSYIHDC